MENIEELLEIDNVNEKDGVDRYFSNDDFYEKGIPYLLLSNKEDTSSFVKKTLVNGTTAYFVNDNRKNNNVYLVEQNNYCIVNKNGEPITTEDGFYVRLMKDPVGKPNFAKVEKNNIDNVAGPLDKEELSKNEHLKVSTYELLMENKEKMEQFLGDISGFCQDNNYKDKIEAIDNKNKEIEIEINELEKNINEYDSKSADEKVILGPKENLEVKKREHEENKEKLERVKESYKVFQDFTQAASENVEEIKRMYEYYNTLENNENITDKQRDEVKQKITERAEKLYKQLQNFRKNVNETSFYNEEIKEGSNVDLNKANLECQLAIIKEKTDVEQKQNREINKEQLQLWKDEFSDNPEARKRVNKDRKKKLSDWEQELDRVSDKISEKQKDLNYICEDKDNIEEIKKITKDTKDISGNYNYNGLNEKQSDYKKSHSINWDDVHDIKSFMKFVKEHFFGDYDKAKEHYNNYGKNDLIEKNGMDKAVNLAKDGENTLKNESEKNPKERAEEALKFEMVNYLVNPKEGNLDIEEAKEITQNAKFDKQPLKKYAENLETIYKKKEKIQKEGDIPLTLDKINNALEQGVTSGILGTFTGGKTKENARGINNLVMGAITEGVKNNKDIKEKYGDNAKFDDLTPKEKSTVIKKSLENFNIEEVVATNSIFASDKNACKLVLQGFENIKNLVEKSAKDEEVLKECDNQIKKQIENAQNAINEKSARCASEHYKEKIKEEKDKEKVDYTKVKELQIKSNDFKKKEGKFKGGLADRVKKVLKPFVKTVDKDAIRRKNVTENQLKSNDAIKALNFKDTNKKLDENLKSQFKINREEQRQNSKNSNTHSFP